MKAYNIFYAYLYLSILSFSPLRKIFADFTGGYVVDAVEFSQFLKEKGLSNSTIRKVEWICYFTRLKSEDLKVVKTQSNG